MSDTGFLVSAIIVIIVAVGGGSLVYSLIDVDSRRRHQEVGSTVFLQVGVMFAVLLAFVFNQVWGEYNIASQAVNGESAALHNISMLADTLPDRMGRPAVDSILRYAQRVSTAEWAAMARFQHDEEAVHDMQVVVRTVVALDPPPAFQSVKGEMLSLLAEAHANRETRFYQMTQLLPWPIWAILIAYSFILLLFVALAGTEGRIAHTTINGTFAACTVLVLLLIYLLDAPFRGLLAIPPTDFIALIRRIHAWG